MIKSNNPQLPWQHVYDELKVVVPSLECGPLAGYVDDYASSNPDAPALQYFDRCITYIELNLNMAFLVFRNKF